MQWRLYRAEECGQRSTFLLSSVEAHLCFNGQQYQCSHEQRRIEETNETYENLYKLNSRHRDTEWWRTSKRLDICSENARECEHTYDTHQGIHNLFTLEPPRDIYRQFRKHALSTRQEIAVNIVNPLKAILTDATNSFKIQISEKGKRASACETN